MAGTGFIFIYWKRQQKLFNKNFAVIKNYPETEAVREIRTSIKKLRAIRRLYVLMTGEELTKLPFNETEDLFSVLGSQRDIEVCLYNLGTYEKDNGTTYPEFSRFLRSSLEISRKWTTKAIKKYKKKELVATSELLESWVAKDNMEGAEDKFLHLITSGLAELKNYLKQPHELRKHLKEIYYWIKMAKEFLSADIPIEKIVNILEAFGEWRNLRVFKSMLRHFRKDYLPKVCPEYGSLKAIEADANDRSEKFLKAALAGTRELLKKV